MGNLASSASADADWVTLPIDVLRNEALVATRTLAMEGPAFKEFDLPPVTVATLERLSSQGILAQFAELFRAPGAASAVADASVDDEAQVRTDARAGAAGG